MENLPIIKSATCARYRLATRLIRVMVDEQQVAWQETDAGNPRSAVNVESLEAAMAAQAPSGEPWTDYDPIIQDMTRIASRSICKPVFMGD